MQLSKRLLPLLALSLSLSMIGCGSESSSSFPSTGPVSPVTSQGFFLGRVLLDDFVEGADVTIVDLQNNVLHTGLKTDHLGLFHSRGGLPDDFRILVRRSGSNMVYVREIRGGYHGGTMYVHPLTTLISLYLATHPGISLMEAEARARAHFAVPAGFSFNAVTNAGPSPFHPAEFQRLAVQNGEVSYYQRISQQLEVSAKLDDAAEAAVESGGDSLLKTVGLDVLGDAVSVTDAGIFGHVTQALGLNLGTSGALNAISTQLNAVLQGISDLAADINNASLVGTFKDDRDAMAPSVSNLYAANAAINATLGDKVANTPTALATTIRAYTTIGTDANLIEGYLDGSGADNIVTTLAKYQGGLYKLSSTDLNNYVYYPVRTNAVTSLMRKNLTFYLNHLKLAGNLYAESASLQIPVASALTTASANIRAISQFSLKAQAQVPDLLPSDNVLIDLRTGTSWYLKFMTQTDWQTAYDTAYNFEEGGYTDWQLAGRDTISDFVQNRIRPLVDDKGNSSQWENAFKTFGFDTSNYGKQHFDGRVGFSNDNRQGQSYMLADLSTPNNDDTYQWEGVTSAPATAQYGNRGNSTSTYLIERAYSANSDANIGSAFATAQVDSTPLQITANDTQLKATTQPNFRGDHGRDTSNPNEPLRLDVTARSIWTSSNDAMASVSYLPGNNLNQLGNSTYDPGPIGNITWHAPFDGSAPTPVTFTAQLWGGNPGDTFGNNSGIGLNSASGNITLSPPAGLQGTATVGSIQILPANSEIDVSGSTGSKTLSFYATAFYKDGRFVDISRSATTTYELVDSSGAAVSLSDQTGFTSTSQGELVVYSTVKLTDAKIKVTYKTPDGKSVSGFTALRIDHNQ